MGRGIRAPEVAERFAHGLKLTREVLSPPDDYVLLYTPGSDTGAVEAALWGMLGQRPDGTGNAPAARIASWQVFQPTPRLAATRAIDIRSTTTCLTANMIASRDSFPFDGAAAVMLWLERSGRSGQAYASRSGRALRLTAEGAALLAEGDDFPVQAYRYGNAVALQFHPEVVHTPKGTEILSSFLFDISRFEIHYTDF